MSDTFVTVSKGELQKLRTSKNLMLKCIKQISYRIEHINSKPYDYGEAYENAISDVKEFIKEYDRKVSQND